MSKLYEQVCKELARSPMYSTTEQLGVKVNPYKFHCIRPKQVLESEENKLRLINVMRDLGYKGKYLVRFPQITRNAKTQYKETGWKYTEEFLDHQRLYGGDLYSVVINIGDKLLYSKKTVEIALKAVKKLAKDCPAYWKIERNDSLKNNIHVHILILVDEGHKFPKKVNNFSVAPPIELGSQEGYKHKTTFENVRDFMMYLYKPADGRASFQHIENVQQMYLEWWEEMLRTELDGKPQWERVSLRGALNLNVKWLKGYDQTEIEGRYISELEEGLEAILEENSESGNPVSVEEKSSSGRVFSGIISDNPLRQWLQDTTPLDGSLFLDDSRIYSGLPP